jgi:hypothetical protein
MYLGAFCRARIGWRGHMVGLRQQPQCQLEHAHGKPLYVAHTGSDATTPGHAATDNTAWAYGYQPCQGLIKWHGRFRIPRVQIRSLGRGFHCFFHSSIPSACPARLLDACPRAYRHRLRHFIDTETGTDKDHRLRSSYWRAWAQFCRATGRHPTLYALQQQTDHLERAELFMAFARAVRDGEFDHGKRASHSKVTKTLQCCASYMVDHGFADPRRQDPSQKEFDPSFRRLLKRYKQEDPPPKRQLALPVSTIRWIASTYGRSADLRLQAIGDLVTLAYFFLLRVCEYATTTETRLTQPLRKRDVRLWRGHDPISPDADWETLASATSVTICLAMQKNGDKDSVLHHTSSEDAQFDPVRAIARRLHALRHAAPDTSLSSVGTTTTAVIYDRDIRAAVQTAARATNLPAKGFPLNLLGTHSIRAAGATALALRGYDGPLIQKMGRWRGETYLLYIQSQIAELTQGVARAMAPSLSFHHVG